MSGWVMLAEFFTPIVPMSRNQRDRAHWGKVGRECRDIFMTIPEAHGTKRQADEGPPRKLRIVITKKGRASDRDNKDARAKDIIDACVKRGWLFDDDPKHLGDYEVIERRPSANHTNPLGTVIEVYVAASGQAPRTIFERTGNPTLFKGRKAA